MRHTTIVFLAAPNTQILDVAGPYQIFVRAAELFVRGHPTEAAPYTVVLASSTGRASVRTDRGLLLGGGQPLDTLRGRIDPLLIAGGSGLDEAAKNEKLLAWLRTTAPRVRRIG